MIHFFDVPFGILTYFFNYNLVGIVKTDFCDYTYVYFKECEYSNGLK